MWGDTTLQLGWEATLICVTFQSLTCHQHYLALETDKGISRSTWSQHKNSKYADLSSLTYHQHYPTLEMDKSTGKSNWNA